VLLAGAIILPGLILAGDAYRSWRQEWRDAGTAVGRTSDSAAEYALRVFEGHKLRLERVNDMLRGLTNNYIRSHEREVHNKLRKFVEDESGRNLSIVVFDRDGRALASATTFPVSREPFPNQDFNQLLNDLKVAEPVVSPVYQSVTDGKRYYAVSRRRDAGGNVVATGTFDGVVSMSIYLESANETLVRLLDTDDDVVSLLRSDGYILARTAGLEGPIPARIRTNDAIVEALRRGDEQLTAIGAAGFDNVERLFSLRRVSGWPVYALAARPTSAIAAEWRQALMPQLLIGVPAWLGLIALALLVRRSQAELERRVDERTAGLLQAAAALHHGEQRLRLAHLAAGIGYWERDLVTGETTWSPEMYALYGLDPVRDGKMGHERYFDEIVHPDDRAKVMAAAKEANASGTYECEYRVVHKRPDGRRDLRWIVGRGVVVGGTDGTHRRLIGANVDITARKEAEEQEAMLMREVDHRAKNVLAIVLSLLRLTPREGVADFAASVEGRVAAMGRVHTLLAEHRWAGADLKQIVDAELYAYVLPRAGRETRVTVAGPAVRLAPHVAQAMSVVLHELATNAIKYGALSVPEGRLALSWRTDAAGTLYFEWRESGGPTVSGPPARRGFGSRLLDSTIRRQMGGELTLDWAPNGLRCVIVAPEAADSSATAVSAAD